MKNNLFDILCWVSLALMAIGGVAALIVFFHQIWIVAVIGIFVHLSGYAVLIVATILDHVLDNSKILTEE